MRLITSFVLLVVACDSPVIDPPACADGSTAIPDPADGAVAHDADAAPDAGSEPSLDAGPLDGGPPPIERLGLHFTRQELVIWRRRAEEGPYRSAGDASERSPGDWERIARNAEAFLADPDAELWAGDYAGCEVLDGRSHSVSEVHSIREIRDAAFVYLLTGDTRYSDAVRRILLAQARLPASNFADESRFCRTRPGISSDRYPGFMLAEWLDRLLFSYDYTKDTFSPSERAEMNAWFRAAAENFMEGTFWMTEWVFEDRFADDYRLSAEAVSRWGYDLSNYREHAPNGYTHANGNRVYRLADAYTNRRTACMTFAGKVGVMLDDEELIEGAKRWFTEAIRFSMYPDGSVGDFLRASSTEPDRGWGYATSILFAMVDFADTLARAGDRSLYEYETSDGYFGTEGGAKSIRKLATTLLQLTDGTLEWYAHTSPLHVGDIAYRIDGRSTDGREAVYDIHATRISSFFHDEYLRSVYTRRAPGTSPYPERVRSAGPYDAWMGNGGRMAGMLFMFGDTEDEVWPYL